MKIVCFFDYVDIRGDTKQMDLYRVHYKAETGRDVKIICTESEIEFELNLSPNCLAIIDYGAMTFGHGDLMEHYDRFMFNIIEKWTSVNFVYRLTLGTDPYREDIFLHDNVETIDCCAGLDAWKQLFDKHWN